MRSTRARFIAPLFTIALLAGPLPVATASAQTFPDTTGMLTPWRIEPAAPCTRDSVVMVVRGFLATPCDSFLGATATGPLRVRIRTQRYLDRRCLVEPTAFYPVRVPLGRFAAGTHAGTVEVETIGVRDDGTTTRDLRAYRFELVVAAVCDSVPPPSGRLPYVERIDIGRDALCGPEPPCPDDSIAVRVSGVFPHRCLSLHRVQLIPPAATIVPPPPPTLRLIVDDGCCPGSPCADVLTPWMATAKLPPMPAGDHVLTVELAEVCCADTVAAESLHRALVPFKVAERCPEPPVCLVPEFARDTTGGSGCHATVAPGRPAELTFLVRPTVGLAGLQGEFRLQPSALRVTRIEPIGPAAGMLLDWTPTSDGARFVLFAPSGAPIPPYPGAGPWATPGGWPVLRVTVGLPAGAATAPEQTVLTTPMLLGADLAGSAVPLCPPPPCASFDVRVAPGWALICSERLCDFNGDGLQDIRDIVLMVHCVNGEGPCPPEAPARFDCDGDGVFGLPDVLCCARHVLRRPPCPDCPPDTAGARPEPGIAVTLGAPVESEAGVEIPIRIAGSDRLGGALLTLEAPLDRYDVTGFEGAPPGRWLTLHEVRDGRLVLGLLGLGGANPARDDAEDRFTLRLALRPGRPAGGVVTAVAGEFSGPDGVALDVGLGRPSQTLPGAPSLELGASRPNPFSTETAFTLQLAAPADVVVGIYDLRGRAVASLHRAPLAAGPHVFRWDGRRSDGGAAPNGIYFYQATVAGRSVARKLILMRGD